jgi:hypothetical protein
LSYFFLNDGLNDVESFKERKKGFKTLQKVHLKPQNEVDSFKLHPSLKFVGEFPHFY